MYIKFNQDYSNVKKDKPYKVTRKDGDRIYFISEEGVEDWAHRNNTIETKPAGKLIGYKIIKEYPYSHPIGHIITFSPCMKEFVEKYPDFFEEVYEEEKKEVILTFGKLRVTVTDKGIFAEGKEWDADKLELLITNYRILNGYDIKIMRIKIGCQEFSSEDIQKIIDTYRSLQKKS